MRMRYSVTPSLMGWAYTQYDPCWCCLWCWWYGNDSDDDSSDSSDRNFRDYFNARNRKCKDLARGSNSYDQDIHKKGNINYINNNNKIRQRLGNYQYNDINGVNNTKNKINDDSG